MSNLSFLLLTVILTLSVQITRFLPFLFFKKTDALPPVIDYLGTVLPPATMGMLIIYCLKDTLTFPGGLMGFLPTLIASAAVIGLHLWKRKAILSISVGTVLYMILLRLI